ncbi:MAG: hypothetical protein AB7J86_19080 [Vulcanimicrobiota bacterium]
MLALLFGLANGLAYGPVRRLVILPVEGRQQMMQRFKPRRIALGDSHFAALNLSGEGMLNLAQAGDSFAEMRAKLNYCLEQGFPLEAVLLQVDYHSFSGGRSIRNNLQQGVLYTNPDSYHKIYGGGPLEYLKATRFYPVVPLANPVNARLTRRYFINKLDPEVIPVWESAAPEVRREFAEARFRVNFSRPFDPAQKAQFLGLVEDCRRANLRVVGATCPLSPYYRRLVEGSDELVLARQAIAESGLEVIDLMARYDDPAAFNDPDHLLGRGEPAREVQQLLLQRLSP